MSLEAEDLTIRLAKSKTGKIRNKKAGLNIDVYNFSNIPFIEEDLRNPIIERLVANYGRQLLIPLFQESPLYSSSNKTSDGKPRYEKGSALKEVSEYLGISNGILDKVFILLDNATTEKPFEDLIGYTIGHGIQAETLEEFFNRKLVVGALGSGNDGSFESNISIAELRRMAPKIMYYSGVGIAERYQGHRLGLRLMRDFVVEAQNKNYEFVMTRIAKGAINWSLFMGIDDGTKTALPTVQIAAKYMNYSMPDPFYRAIFVFETEPVINKLEQLIKEKNEK